MNPLMAAIQGGADSVYFGAGMLKMRSASSNNFNLDALRNIASICRDNGWKVILRWTLWSMIRKRGDAEDRRYCAESGITAISASDIAAIDYAFRSGIEVHLSTQLNISKCGGIEVLFQICRCCGAGQENWNLDQVRHIHENDPRNRIWGVRKGELVKIEMFVHGALCMAVSGKCYLSLHETIHLQIGESVIRLAVNHISPTEKSQAIS